ncbi:MAG: hypothetical protein A2163_04035 [Actinobacteria bacterium RBG_13_35_12]|nr:MAG: hypothetical protein A2163_04035 [Actinobacteria bacterium RBG_13_35_12]
MNKLGDIIKEKGLKKGFIAKKIGVSIPTLQRYIEGINYPGADIANKLSKILGYSIEAIFFTKDTIKVVNDKS